MYNSYNEVTAAANCFPRVLIGCSESVLFYIGFITVFNSYEITYILQY